MSSQHKYSFYQWNKSFNFSKYLYEINSGSLKKNFVVWKFCLQNDKITRFLYFKNTFASEYIQVGNLVNIDICEYSFYEKIYWSKKRDVFEIQNNRCTYSYGRWDVSIWTLSTAKRRNSNEAKFGNASSIFLTINLSNVVDNRNLWIFLFLRPKFKFL